MIQQLAAISQHLNTLEFRDDAMLSYDVMSDALFWSDEIPFADGITLRVRDLWCLRPVLRYRTSLIICTPEERFYEHWKRATEMFPLWPGFRPCRCAYSTYLESEYMSRRLRNRAIATE